MRALADGEHLIAEGFGNRFYVTNNGAGGVILFHECERGKPAQIMATSVHRSRNSERYVVLQKIYKAHFFHRMVEYLILRNEVVGDFDKEWCATNNAREWATHLGKNALIGLSLF
ncbi:MAG: hypothetical protein AABW80_00635 [Nanoarchaeota archaeon]